MAASGRGLTYRKAGVDIDAADRLVARIGRMAATTRRPEVLSGVGLFAAAIRMPRGYREPVLLASADGVGTKLAVARLVGRHDTVGIDLVAMNVNDILTTGARPLFFLDYLSAGSLSSIDADAVVAGIAEGCRLAGVSLVGGETAEMPGFYPAGEYDLAGFAVGVAERRRLLNGSRIRPGDVLVGLEASGLHSNGYSLARRALGLDGGRRARSILAKRLPGTDTSLSEALLRPTRIYVKPVLSALERFRIKGMAHITGGGIPGNLVRILPTGTAAVIDRTGLPGSDVLRAVQEAGGIGRREMDRTFNGGVGFILAVARRQAAELCELFRRRRVPAHVIGEIVAGRRGVRYRGRR